MTSTASSKPPVYVACLSFPSTVGVYGGASVSLAANPLASSMCHATKYIVLIKQFVVVSLVRNGSVLQQINDVSLLNRP